MLARGLQSMNNRPGTNGGCFILCTFFCLALASPIAVRAQFQQPTDEELKMTSDPKAPGADAVYLEIKDITNDVKHSKSEYCRIKVLADKGKELATIEVPYFSGHDTITGVRGRTIHSDGTIVPLNVKPEDLLVSKIQDREFKRKVFTLPSVEVGSVLEYTYQLDYVPGEVAPPRWEIQRKHFVHKAHYEFQAGSGGWDSHTRLLNNTMVFRHLPTGVTLQVPNGPWGPYKLDVSDIAPVPDEEWMPPIDSLLYRVHFFYSPTLNPAEFWQQDMQFWAKDVDKFAKWSKRIQDAVDGLIAPTDSDLDKARKLYDAVQALDNTDFSHEKSKTERKKLRIKEAKHAQDTWTEKSGSSEDIAMLYLAMLRAAKLSSYAVRVVDREQNMFDLGDIDLDQFDATLVYLSSGDKQVLLDPGERMCPFGTVSWRHSDAGAITESAKGTSLATTSEQDDKDNLTSRSGDLFLDTQGGAKGTLSIVMTGQAALYWRQEAVQNDDSEVKKEFDERLVKTVPDGVEAHVDHFQGMSDPYANLLAVVNLHGALGTVTGKRMIVPGFLFGAIGSVPFVNEEKRQEPVDMHYGEQITDEITLHLPDGMTVEGAPQDNEVSWPDHALFTAKAVSGSGQIVVSDTLTRAFTMLKAEEYQDLRGFYQKVAAADQQQIVLTKAPAAGKGN